MPWYNKSWGWTKLAAETGWRGAEITAQYSRIGALETTKWTAISILEIAKQTFRKLEIASKLFPIEADPRMVALYGTYATATAALQGARDFLELFKNFLEEMI